MSTAPPFLASIQSAADQAWPHGSVRLGWSSSAVGYWLACLGHVPGIEEIRAKLGCSRATAYRWFTFAQRAQDVVKEITDDPA